MSDQEVTIDDDSPDHPVGDRRVPSIDDFAEQVDQPGKRGLQKKWACKGVGCNFSRVCGKMRVLGHCLSFYKTPDKGSVTAFHTDHEVAKCTGKWTPAQKDSMYSLYKPCKDGCKAKKAADKQDMLESSGKGGSGGRGSSRGRGGCKSSRGSNKGSGAPRKKAKK